MGLNFTGSATAKGVDVLFARKKSERSNGNEYVTFMLVMGQADLGLAEVDSYILSCYLATN